MSPARPRLDGQKLIADRLGLSVRQVRKLRSTLPPDRQLPVFRLSAEDGRNCRLSAFIDELDAWVEKMRGPWAVRISFTE